MWKILLKISEILGCLEQNNGRGTHKKTKNRYTAQGHQLIKSLSQKFQKLLFNYHQKFSEIQTGIFGKKESALDLFLVVPSSTLLSISNLLASLYVRFLTCLFSICNNLFVYYFTTITCKRACITQKAIHMYEAWNL